MARILLGWEKGDGFYHLQRLLRLQEAFKSKGHECIMAVNDLKRAREYIRNSDIAIIQCPLIPASADRFYKQNKAIESIADILLGSGYCDAQALDACILAWQHLIKELAIDLAISDYSPSLNLATKGKIPTIAIGDGFTMARIENGMAAGFNGAFSDNSNKSSLTAIDKLSQLMQSRVEPSELLKRMIYADKGFCITFKELDHNYCPQLRTTIGPLSKLRLDPLHDESTSQDSANHISTTKECRPTKRYDYFAYLSLDYEGSLSLLEGAKASGYQGCAYLRDCPKELRSKLESDHLSIFSEPQDLYFLLGSTRSVIHHGGLGTLENCLAAGKPQLLAPRHKEQILNVQSVLKLGCAVSMRSNAKFGSSHAQAALRALLSNKDFEATAKEISQGLSQIPDSCDQILDYCQAFIG